MDFSLKDYITDMRRKIHLNPELSMREFETAKLIRDELKSMGYKFKTVGTGTYCDVKGESKKLVAFRCDIDALPIVEQTGLCYAATNGCMHACGHDGHTALMLGFAKYLIEHKPNNSLRLIFQCGEEGEGGAETLIEAGALNGVSEIYAIHMNPSLELGTISTLQGAMFAGCVEFDLEFSGVATHCAEQSKVDALRAATDVYQASQKLKDKYNNKLLFHVGKIVGGSARNVVADKATMLCTLRYFDEDLKEAFIMDLSKALVDTDIKLYTSHRFTVTAAYPPLINTLLGFERVKSLVEYVECEPKWTAEDFAFYLDKVDGCMMWLGCKDTHFSSPLHSATFGFDEEALMTGLNAFVKLANA